MKMVRFPGDLVVLKTLSLRDLFKHILEHRDDLNYYTVDMRVSLTKNAIYYEDLEEGTTVHTSTFVSDTKLPLFEVKDMGGENWVSVPVEVLLNVAHGNGTLWECIHTDLYKRILMDCKIDCNYKVTMEYLYDEDGKLGYSVRHTVEDL